ncbi:MAG: polyferredoxin [Polaribacter sp.]|jgi:polyferredoxin
MNLIQKIGIGLLMTAIGVFILSLGFSNYTLTAENLSVKSEFHKSEILAEAKNAGILGKTFTSNVSFISAFKDVLNKSQSSLNKKATAGLPDGVGEWDYKIGDWEIKGYIFENVKSSAGGLLPNNVPLFFFLTFGFGIIGGLLYVLPMFNLLPGIKNNNIYHNSLTRGLQLNVRTFFLLSTIACSLLYGIVYMGYSLFFPILSLVAMGLTYYLVNKGGEKENAPTRSASPDITGWFGVIAGIFLILFYILLYWAPHYITNWIALVDPLSRFLSGNAASQWFLYGFLYTIIVIVMGIRMIAKYRHNRYQMIRTTSVMFFQTAFAFLIPEMMVRLNQPWYDFKNIWPLNYTFFFDWNINQLISSGNFGIFMLVWGIVLALIGVPLFTYFFGKRWYCSWVCGCGGLAETMGDPYRQLSDKSVKAWKYERYIIHGVLLFAVLMTIGVLYSYFTGNKQLLFLNTDTVRQWYGFLIGSAFAGVVGTGFYPLMGNRTWCRFGCPLAGYLGLVQRFKSRFRITTNGGQCISCGNCSTYCEMGIDVRAYAQKGQNIVRASCVGCGICAAVCPRGVLKLENGSADISERTTELKGIHIQNGKVRLVG